FWMKSFGIHDENKNANALFERLLGNDGWDPYLENEGTLLLLHYELCANNYSSIYNIIFRELRKIKPEFTRDNFVQYIRDIDASQNEKILEKNFSVLLRMYSNDKKDKAIEDGYSGLL